MTNLDTQYRTAQARLSAADDAVRRASRERLAVLRRLSVREQLDHVADADLTLEDRAALRRSIAAKLSRPPLRPAFRRIAVTFIWRRLARRPFALGMRTATVLVIGAWITTVWLHAGQLTAWDRAMTLVWTLPSGETFKGVLEPGVSVVLVHHYGAGSYFRYWLPGEGYATAPVNVIEAEK
jgi:hypothetical protein